MDSEYENFKSILDKADIIVQVLDARDPLAFESKDLQNHVKQKENSKLIYVLAKIGEGSHCFSLRLLISLQIRAPENQHKGGPPVSEIHIPYSSSVQPRLSYPLRFLAVHRRKTMLSELTSFSKLSICRQEAIKYMSQL